MFGKWSLGRFKKWGPWDRRGPGSRTVFAEIPVVGEHDVMRCTGPLGPVRIETLRGASKSVGDRSLHRVFGPANPERD